jgi:3-phosphoshikimate 1-carboxyvinyltransferase
MSSRSTAIVSPARRLRGRLRVPGDKSISHRYAILAGLANGRSTLANYAPGADCRSTLTCLRTLGVTLEEGSAGAVTVMGRGLGQLRSPSGALDAGNSGTTMRLMSGVKIACSSHAGSRVKRTCRQIPAAGSARRQKNSSGLTAKSKVSV